MFFLLHLLRSGLEPDRASNPSSGRGQGAEASRALRDRLKLELLIVISSSQCFHSISMVHHTPDVFCIASEASVLTARA